MKCSLRVRLQRQPNTYKTQWGKQALRGWPAPRPVPSRQHRAVSDPPDPSTTHPGTLLSLPSSKTVDILQEPSPDTCKAFLFEIPLSGWIPDEPCFRAENPAIISVSSPLGSHHPLKLSPSRGLSPGLVPVPRELMRTFLHSKPVWRQPSPTL